MNATTDRGETALHTAAAAGHYKVSVEPVLTRTLCCGDPMSDVNHNNARKRDKSMNIVFGIGS